MALALKMEYEAWLKEYRWNWFCTLTLRKNFGRKAANLLFALWLSELRQHEKHDLSWVRVAEFGDEGGRLHFHAVIAGIRCTPPKIAELLWERIAGAAEVDEIDPERNAIGYLLKQLEEGPDIDFDANLRPRDRIRSRSMAREAI